MNSLSAGVTPTGTPSVVMGSLAGESSIPSLPPTVSPKFSPSQAVPFPIAAENNEIFTVMNLGTAPAVYTLRVQCTGWATNCWIKNFPQVIAVAPGTGRSFIVAFPSAGVLTAASEIPVDVKLIAEQRVGADTATQTLGTDVVSADTGVLHPVTGFHTPQLSPHAGSVSVPTGTSRTDSYTLKNLGNMTARYDLAASCGAFAGCSLSTPSVTLDPGVSGTVSVTYTPAATAGQSATIQLIADYDYMQYGVALHEADTSRVVSTTVVAPPRTMPPTVTPKATATQAQVFPLAVEDDQGFTVMNLGTAPAVYTLTARCTGWAASCWIKNVPRVIAIAPGAGRSLLVAFPGSGVLGSPAEVPVDIELVAEQRVGADTATQTLGTTVVSADTGLGHAVTGFHTPAISPHSGTVTDTVGIARTRTYTLQNLGNMTARYDLAASCGAFAGCTPSVPSITLDPGAAGTVNVTYMPPATAGQSATIQLIADYDYGQFGVALHEADTSRIVATTVAPPPPSLPPDVSPKQTAGQVHPFPLASEDDESFWITNHGATTAVYTLTTQCTGWAATCWLKSPRVIAVAPNVARNVLVAFPGSGILGSPAEVPIDVKLFVEQRVGADTVTQTLGTTVVSADSGIMHPTTGFHTPQLSPHSGTVTDTAGIARTQTYTLQNLGNMTARYDLAASCGAFTGCTPTVPSITLDPGASGTVGVTFSPPTSGGSATIQLIADYDYGQFGVALHEADTSRVAATTIVLPPATMPPQVFPKQTAGQVRVFPLASEDDESFSILNAGATTAIYTLSAQCTGWAASCWLKNVSRVISVAPNTERIILVAFPGSGILGSPAEVPIDVKLLVEQRVGADTSNQALGSTVVSADSGMTHPVTGYHRPLLSPHTATTGVTAGVTRTENYTLENMGNMTARYDLSASCGSFGTNGCALSAPSVTLDPGASSAVTITYTPPATGLPTAAIQLIADYDYGQFGVALHEADTARVVGTRADAIPPTIAITPADGATVSTRLASVAVDVCDSDGIVTAPAATFNGVTVTGTYVSTTVSGCATSGTATFAVPALTTLNTFVATTTDGVHTTSLTRTFNYDEANDEQPQTTALAASHVVAGGAAASETFTVRNPGSLAATYTLTPTCGALASGCSASASSLALAAGQSSQVTVSYTAQATSSTTTISLASRYVSTKSTTVTSQATTNVTIDAEPPNITIVSPTSDVVTRALSQAIVVAWCDQSSALVERHVRLDGQLLPDNFAPVTGCVASGTSTWLNWPVSPGAHTITADAMDGVGHVTTVSTSFTMLAPIASFQPDVTPKSISTTVDMSALATQQFTIRNAGSLPATYVLTPSCPAATTCAVSRSTLTVAPGSADTASVLFSTPVMLSMSTAVSVTATYTAVDGQTVNDQGSITAWTPSIESYYAESAAPLVSSALLSVGSTATYTFQVTNLTSHFNHYNAGFNGGGLTFVVDSLAHNITLDLGPGETKDVSVEVQAPNAALLAQLSFNVRAVLPTGTQQILQVVWTTVSTMPHAVVVVPAVGPFPVNLPLPGDFGAEYLIRNVSNSTDSYSYQFTCSGPSAGCHSSTGSVSGTITLGPGATQTMTGTFDVPPGTTASGTQETITLSVDGLGAAAGTHADGSILYLLGQQTISHAVTVTPSSSSISVPPGTVKPLSFTIRNTSTDPSGTPMHFNYSLSCVPSAACSSQTGQTDPLAPNGTGSAEVTVSFAAPGTAPSSGSATLTVTGVEDPSLHATGVWTVTTQSLADVVVAAIGKNLGGAVERGACVTVPAGSNAAYECGDLRLSHAMPGTTTMGALQAPVLTYNSRHHNEKALFAADVYVPPGNDAITGVNAHVLITPSAGAQEQEFAHMPFVWQAQWNGGAPRRLVVPVDVSSLKTGAYHYAIAVDMQGGSTTTQYRDTGTVAIVNRLDSPFGAGWWLDGLEQLVPYSTNQKLWVAGDGSARLYTQANDSIWTVQPTIDRPDTLIQRGTSWFRALRNGGYVEFDNLGRMDTLVSATGMRTVFAYVDAAHATPMSMELPRPVSSTRVQRYTFNYLYQPLSGGPSYLSSVVAPSSPDGARVINVSHGAGKITISGFSGPDTYGVSFGYDASGRLTTRTDRRGFTTRFDYDDVANVLTGSTLLMQGSSADLVQSFCAAEATSLLPCEANPTDSSAVVTTLTNQRGAATKISLNAFGALTRLTDALGRSTTIERADSRWPLLPTAVVRPNGFTTRIAYNERALIATSTDQNPFASGDAVTTYGWNATSRFDELETITSPTNQLTRMGYDGNGDVAWQEDGRGAPSHVTLIRNADRQVNRVESPSPATAGGIVATVYGYDAQSGNVNQVTTPRGMVTTTTEDLIGRPVQVQSPLNDAPTSLWRYQTFRYDTLDRVRFEIDSAPANRVNGNGWQAVQVETRYDAEGNSLNAIRTVRPDSGTLQDIVVAAEYDGAGRMTHRYDPNKPGSDVTMAYDALQGVVTVTRGVGAGTGTDVTSFDVIGRPVTRSVSGVPASSDPTADADVQRFVYDNMDNLVSATNKYAQVGRAYTLGGAIASDTLRIADTDLSAFSHVYVNSYHYDPSGRRVSFTAPNNVGMTGGLIGTVNYGYDPVTGALSSISAPSYGTFTYFTGAAGELDSAVVSDGTRQQYTYDADGRPKTRVEKAADNTVYHNDFLTMDGSGNMTNVATTTFGAAKSFGFGYTGLGAVLVAGGPQNESYARDPLGNALTRSVSATTWQGDFTNRFEPHSTRISGITGVPAAQTDYSLTPHFDLLGNLTERDELVHLPVTCWPQLQCAPDQTPGEAWSSLFNSYRGDGQLVSSVLRTSNDALLQIDTTQVFPYASMGRGVFEEYRYDALGRRVWMRAHRDPYCLDVNVRALPICASAVERFVYDGDQVLYEIRQPGHDTASAAVLENDLATDPRVAGQYGVVAYLNGPATDAPLAMVRVENGFATYAILHRDWQGAVDFATTTAGGVLDCGRPGAMVGCQHIPWPGLDMSVGFQRPVSNVGSDAWWGTLIGGNQNATGTIDMRARQFDPKLGQFMQEDPISLAGGLNTYGFADGDAVNHRDPTGLEPDCPPGVQCLDPTTSSAMRVIQDLNWAQTWDYIKDNFGGAARSVFGSMSGGGSLHGPADKVACISGIATVAITAASDATFVVGGGLAAKSAILAARSARLSSMFVRGSEQGLYFAARARGRAMIATSGAVVAAAGYIGSFDNRGTLQTPTAGMFGVASGWDFFPVVATIRAAGQAINACKP